MNSSKGFTLVELLIGVTLGLFLLGGLSAFLVATHAFVNKQHLEADIQERLRYAFYRMGQDIEKAGFLGCQNARGTNSRPEFYLSSDEEQDLHYHSPVTLLSSLDAVWLSYATEDKPPDGVTVRAASSCANTVVFSENAEKRQEMESFFKKKNEAIRTDLPVVTVHYYLDGDHGLYRDELKDKPDELVPNVSDMRIIQGIDENGDGKIKYQEKPILPSKISALKVRLGFGIAGKSFKTYYERTFLLHNRCFVGKLDG